MRTKFDEQLKQLNDEMMQMGFMIQDSIQKAIESLVRQDVELAKTIIEGDMQVDREQKRIEDICFNLLMQQQPVARDLRTISAAMKMVTDMERIGDHAADICEMTIMMSDAPYTFNLDHINKMASETMLMLMRSIEAYVKKDIEAAQSVIAHDDVVDELFDQVKKDLIQMVQSDPKSGEQATDMLMVAKYFERIGDHATNIGEWVIFSLDSQGKLSPFRR
ncbi:MAG: phosphate signaling complex protein PhoU [Lachnospiraceae bacterium]|nr:phosphate signaling complex protein PhoU [Lachnospiraceae bacterium]